MTTKQQQNRSGAITIEVALCLPVLLLLLFGCYELARTNMILHGTQSAAYEGARTGIIPGTSPEKIENSVGFVLRTIGVNEFEVETIPAVIQQDTEFVEVNVRVPVARNLALPRLFVKDPIFLGTCRLKREVP